MLRPTGEMSVFKWDRVGRRVQKGQLRAQNKGSLELGP